MEMLNQRLRKSVWQPFYKTMDELGVEVPDEYIKESTYLDSIKAEKLTYELLKLKHVVYSYYV